MHIFLTEQVLVLVLSYKSVPHTYTAKTQEQKQKGIIYTVVYICIDIYIHVIQYMLDK